MPRVSKFCVFLLSVSHPYPPRPLPLLLEKWRLLTRGRLGLLGSFGISLILVCPSHRPLGYTHIDVHTQPLPSWMCDPCFVFCLCAGEVVCDVVKEEGKHLSSSSEVRTRCERPPEPAEQLDLLSEAGGDPRTQRHLSIQTNIYLHALFPFHVTSGRLCYV